MSALKMFVMVGLLLVVMSAEAQTVIPGPYLPYEVICNGDNDQRGLCQVPLDLIAHSHRFVSVALPTACFPRIVSYRISEGYETRDEAPDEMWAAIGGLSAGQRRSPWNLRYDHAVVSFSVHNDASYTQGGVLGFLWRCEDETRW